MRDRLGAEQAIPAGQLEMPKDLGKNERKIWRDYVRWFPAVLLKPSDSMVLADLCRWHVKYMVLLNGGEIDAACKAWAKVNACYNHLGMSPVARAKLEMPQTPVAEADPLEQLKLVGARKAQ
jgi:phage terminase small subunit